MMSNHELLIALALINSLLCVVRFLFCLKALRIFALVWFLIAYFSFFFLEPIQLGPVMIYRGFSGDYLSIKDDDIEFTLYYVILFNLIFFLTEYFLSAIVVNSRYKTIWLSKFNFPFARNLQNSFLIMLVISSVIFLYNKSQFTYTDYVENSESSWDTVFFLASSPFIVISGLRKEFLKAFIACLPYFYISSVLHIRAFLLLSFIPLLIIYFFKFISDKNTSLIFKFKKIFFVLFLLASLLSFNFALMLSKHSGNNDVIFMFPDSGMPNGTVQIIYAIKKFNLYTDWDSLILFGNNFVMPFLKLLNLSNHKIVDPPVLMAQLLDGVPLNSVTFFHYPTLWYGDAFMAFGDHGLFLAVVWAIFLIMFEYLISRNIIMMSLFFSFYSWLIYFLVRGAAASSSTPFSYSFYIVILIAFTVCGARIFKKDIL